MSAHGAVLISGMEAPDKDEPDMALYAEDLAAFRPDKKYLFKFFVYVLFWTFV